MNIPVKEKYRIGGSQKRMGGSTSGNTAPPRKGRRTPNHQKGTPYPGMRNPNPIKAIGGFST